MANTMFLVLYTLFGYTLVLSDAHMINNTGWKEGPDLPESHGRANFATVVDGDSIYIIGGVGDTLCDNMMDNVYHLDTKSESWSKAGTLPESRSNLAAVSFQDKILVLGGCNSGYRPTSTAWLFSPSSNKWSNSTPMSTPRCNFAAVAVKDTVYVIGGYNSDPQNSVMTTVETYSANTNGWKLLAPMNKARQGHGAVEYGGKIYVAGGAHDDTLVREIEMYDPASDKWSLLSTLIKPRMDAAIAVAKGSIYIIGGTSDWKGTSMTNVEVYNIDTNDDEESKSMDGARYGLGAAVVDDVIYAIGGIHTIFGDTNSVSSTSICDSMVEKYIV